MASVREEKYSGKKVFLGSAPPFTWAYLVLAASGEFQYISFPNSLPNSSGYLQQKYAILDNSSLNHATSFRVSQITNLLIVCNNSIEYILAGSFYSYFDLTSQLSLTVGTD